jgi:hypothetical protein
MASMFRGLLARLFGNAAAPAGEDPVEYNGYRIRPTPFPRLGQYQTAGLIEKEIGGEVKEYRFVRAETHSSHEEAIAFSIAKAKQIIDEQGERLFDQS